MILLLGCAGGTPDTATPSDIVADLEAPGPYAVGYRQSSVTYDSAWEPGRTLRLALWFPTEATSGGTAAYLDGAVDAEGVLDDPPPAPGTLPVVIFSHGYQGYAENSSFLATHLASHGYVVAAPDHTGDTTFDDPERTTEIYAQRPQDLSAVLDALPDELDVDTTAVTAIGHSFGGYTVFALGGATYDPSVLLCKGDTSSFCSTMDVSLSSAFTQGFRDTRVIRIVPMAAGDQVLFGAGTEALPVPALQMTGELDPGTPADGEAYWATLSGGPHRRVQLLGAGHQAFTDFSGVLDDGGTIDPAEGFRIVDVYALAALRADAGDSAASTLLNGDPTVSEAAILLR